VGETPEALRDLSVSLDNVGDAAKALGQWETAQKRFEESLEISRQILARVGETPEALRDLSVSLDNVGDAAKALGQWETARKCFDEGLVIGRVLLKALPKHPDYNTLADYFRGRLQTFAKQKTEEKSSKIDLGKHP